MYLFTNSIYLQPPMKNKRVPLKKKSKKQNTKMQLARRLLDNCSSDDEDDEDDEYTSKLLLSKMNAECWQTDQQRQGRILAFYKTIDGVQSTHWCEEGGSEGSHVRGDEKQEEQEGTTQKAKANLQLARKLLENDSSDVVGVDGDSSD